jgi:Predicted HD superfamily hydrolase involved in NAD metabolism
MEEIEKRLLSELENLCKPSRQAHCRFVAETAEFLARRFSVDSFAARVAGLGHDLMKDRGYRVSMGTCPQRRPPSGDGGGDRRGRHNGIRKGLCR